MGEALETDTVPEAVETEIRSHLEGGFSQPSIAPEYQLPCGVYIGLMRDGPTQDTVSLYVYVPDMRSFEDGSHLKEHQDCSNLERSPPALTSLSAELASILDAAVDSVDFSDVVFSKVMGGDEDESAGGGEYYEFSFPYPVTRVGA